MRYLAVTSMPSRSTGKCKHFKGVSDPHTFWVFSKQEAFADGRDGMLALREALERAVDETRGLLERADVAAAEAQGGEVRNFLSSARAPDFCVLVVLTLIKAR